METMVGFLCWLVGFFSAWFVVWSYDGSSVSICVAVVLLVVGFTLFFGRTVEGLAEEKWAPRSPLEESISNRPRK